MTPSTLRELLVPALLPAALALMLGACAPRPAEPAAAPATAPTAPEAGTAPAEPAPAEAVPEETIVTPLPPGTESPATESAPALAGQCNGDVVQSLVGREATDAVLEQARLDSGSSTVRALRPGEPATMDFRPDRLDIALDENGIIQALHCG